MMCAVADMLASVLSIVTDDEIEQHLAENGGAPAS